MFTDTVEHLIQYVLPAAIDYEKAEQTLSGAFDKNQIPGTWRVRPPMRSGKHRNWLSLSMGLQTVRSTISIWTSNASEQMFRRYAIGPVLRLYDLAPLIECEGWLMLRSTRTSQIPLCRLRRMLTCWWSSLVMD